MNLPPPRQHLDQSQEHHQSQEQGIECLVWGLSLLIEMQIQERLLGEERVE